jgi:outer membrane lipoprotein carrier protein
MKTLPYGRGSDSSRAQRAPRQRAVSSGQILSSTFGGRRASYDDVRVLPLLIGLLGVSAFAADPALNALLKGVETRYNKAKTLQVLFHEEYTPPGRAKRTESGTLVLRKPGKMRWDYAQPKGKLFVSDGKYLWLYTPDENRAERMKLKESDDMRAPLAFLLGRLDFQKEFRNLQAKPEGPDTRIAAEPATDNLPYSAVEFVVAPDQHIKVVKVTGFDHSILEFHFDQEKMDPTLDAKLFQFQAPKGAQLVEGQ